jgi:hypothetical protein
MVRLVEENDEEDNDEERVYDGGWQSSNSGKR